jgi:CheY-like chemotaxis protein
MAVPHNQINRDEIRQARNVRTAKGNKSHEISRNPKDTSRDTAIPADRATSGATIGFFTWNNVVHGPHETLWSGVAKKYETCPCESSLKTQGRLSSLRQAMEILLVEDNAGDTVLIRQVLVESGVPVKLHIARDGEQALTMLSGAYFHPSLVILDLNIPCITGPALLERWQGWDIPVVVFSSSVDSVEKERVLALGAREFIHKPIDMGAYAREVLGIVERWSGNKQACGA